MIQECLDFMQGFASGAHIDLKDASWGEVIEGSLENLVTAFAVTDSHDLGLMKAILNGIYGDKHWKPIVRQAMTWHPYT